MTNDYEIIAGISQALKAEYQTENHQWKDSPFEWIKTKPSRQIGAIGERIVAGWLAARNFNIQRSPDSNADKIVENKRLEIKFSTLWEIGCYKFQQIRDQNYDLLLCLGVSPFSAHCWVFTKREIMSYWHDKKYIGAQHGGSAGVDTAWLSVDPCNTPQWMGAHGGSPTEAVKIIAKHVGIEMKTLHEELFAAERGDKYK